MFPVTRKLDFQTSCRYLHENCGLLKFCTQHAQCQSFLFICRSWKQAEIYSSLYEFHCSSHM